jgi:hypothetical protein
MNEIYYFKDFRPIQLMCHVRAAEKVREIMSLSNPVSKKRKAAATFASVIWKEEVTHYPITRPVA